MNKDALIDQLVKALNDTNPFIGYQADVSDLQKQAAAALKAAQLAGYSSVFGEIYVNNDTWKA